MPATLPTNPGTTVTDVEFRATLADGKTVQVNAMLTDNVRTALVGRRVRPGRHRPHDGQPLRRHLHAVVTQELVHLVGRLRVGRFRHSADSTTDSGLSQVLDTFRYRGRMVVAMRAGTSEGDLVVHQSPDRDRGSTPIARGVTQ